MKLLSTSTIRGSVVDLLLIHTMRSESRDCAVVETAEVDGVPSCRAAGRDFEEEG
jgi:hypothetical protein